MGRREARERGIIGVVGGEISFFAERDFDLPYQIVGDFERHCLDSAKLCVGVWVWQSGNSSVGNLGGE